MKSIVGTTANKPRIVLIGPITPYRGGIAQYNTQLYAALKNIANITAISFCRLYPKWLYPGKDDKETDASQKDGEAEYILNAYSPLSLNRAVHRIKKINPDFVVITWWTLFWQPGMAYIAFRLKHSGIKTIFLCHNLFDHDSNIIKQKISQILLRQSSGYIVHAKEHIKEIQSFKPRAKIMQRMLPIYTQYPRPRTKWAKRGKLEILFFGFIRPYKGLNTLVEALEILKDNDIYTSIVGEVWADKKGFEDKIRQKEIPSLETNLQYVSEQEAASYFDRADVVILPYRTATGSAVVATAYNYYKPVIATKVGGLQDAVIDSETGWLVKVNSPKLLAKKISSISRQQAQDMRRPIEKFNMENSWENFAKKVIDFYRKDLS